MTATIAGTDKTTVDAFAPEVRFRSIVNAAGDAIIVTDEAGAIVFANLAAMHMFPTQDLVQCKLSEIVPMFADGKLAGSFRRRSGERLTIEATMRSFTDGGGLHRVYVIRDLTERQHTEEFEALASRDPLTGVWNRRHLVRELRARMAAATRYNTGGALLLVELDHSHEIESSFGFEMSDALLKAVTAAIVKNTRESDLVARVTGTKLAVLLDQTAGGGAELCADKIAVLVREVDVPDESLRPLLGTSVGIAMFTDHPQSVEHVMLAASKALGRAKRDGGARAYTYPSMTDDIC